MFTKATFGVPQFYPRDLKKRVDDYVVGQDRAKKTICSSIFNHYQALRRRCHHEDSDRSLRERLQRQRFARERDFHERQRDPVEGQRSTGSSASRRHADELYLEDEFPDHNESLVEEPSQPPPETVVDFYKVEDPRSQHRVKIDKSNLLLIGPTGVGKTYILE